jgi:prepilin-type N-terminal cleavage/methylation domain-containing protein
MQTSAEQRHQRGFTLLEIMVTVALLGTLILPILQVREVCTRKAYKASQLIKGLSHAEQLFADCVFELRELEDQEGQIESDPLFTYSMTLKEYDLSTGLNVYDDEVDDDVFSDYEEGLLPGDAGIPPDDEDEERASPHRIRRYKISVFWPSWDPPSADDDDEDSFDELTIEGFLPRVFEEEEDDENTEGESP